MTRGRTALIGILAVVVLVGSGCITRKKFRENVASTDSRITSVEDAVEANERRIGDLRAETDSKIGEVSQQAGQAMQTGQQAMTKAEEAERAARGKIVWEVTLTDDNVRFAHDKASLSEGAEAILADLASKVKAYGKAVYVEIEGHTDSTGPDAYNLMLGEKRAIAVRDYLSRSQGLPLHAMNTISYGESQPVADNSTSEGRSQNRRVVVKVLE